MIQTKDALGNVITPIEHVITDFSVYYNNTSVLSFFLDFSQYAEGKYAFKLINQLGIASDLSREFTITTTSVNTPVNTTWDYIGEEGKETSRYVTTNNSVTIQRLIPDRVDEDSYVQNCAYKTDSLITQELVQSGFILEFKGEITLANTISEGSMHTTIEISDLQDSILFGVEIPAPDARRVRILPTNDNLYTGMNFHDSTTFTFNYTQKINIIYKDGIVEIIGLLNNGQFFYSRLYLIDFPISNLSLKVRLGGSKGNFTGVTSKGIVFTNLSPL